MRQAWVLWREVWLDHYCCSQRQRPVPELALCWSCPGQRLPKQLTAQAVLVQVQGHAREEAWGTVMRLECQ